MRPGLRAKSKGVNPPLSGYPPRSVRRHLCATADRLGLRQVSSPELHLSVSHTHSLASTCGEEARWESIFGWGRISRRRSWASQYPPSYGHKYSSEETLGQLIKKESKNRKFCVNDTDSTTEASASGPQPPGSMTSPPSQHKEMSCSTAGPYQRSCPCRWHLR